MKTKLILIFSILTMLSVSVYAQKLTSTYTSTDTKDCKTIEQTDKEGGSYRGICKGVGGYKIELIEGDIRQTVNVIAPNKKKSELVLWTNVSSGFSSVGQKIEWRMKGNVPVAMILRYNASDDPADSSKITSYLVVSKIAQNKVCITEILKPMKDQNIEAQKLADAASSKSCKVFE